VLSSIGIALFKNSVPVALLSMMLFQMTMPITLAAIATALPGKPAFAFGLTCLALIIGTLAAYYVPQGMTKLPVTMAFIGASGVCIVTALRQLGHVRWRIVESLEPTRMNLKTGASCQ